MLAITPMSATVQVIFYLIAFIAFVCVALSVTWNRVGLLGVGLAAVTFVWLWNALAAA